MNAPHPARRGAVYLALATVAVTQPLLQLYGANLAMFTTAQWDGAVILWFAVAVAVVPAATFMGTDVLLSLLVRRHAARVHLALVFVGFWAVVSVVLRSVSVGPWPLDAAMTAGLGAVLAAGYSRSAQMRSWTSWLSPLSGIVVVLFAVSVSSLVWTPGVEASAGAAPGTKDPTVDVVWVQLDEAPLFPLLDSSGTVNPSRFPGFASLASVSTWYRNVLSVSQRTSVAIPAMLTGRKPDYSSQPVAADHPGNLFALMRGHMALDVTEEATHLCTGDWCRPGSGKTTTAAPVVVQARTPFVSFLKDALVVLGHKVLPAGLRAGLPAIDEGWGRFGGDDASVAVPSPSGAGTANPELRSLVGHALRVAKLRTMVQRQAAGTEPTFRFAHIMLPHRPWVLAPDERKSGPPAKDERPPNVVDRRRDAYQSFLNQYVALDAEIGSMVKTLSASPRWSRTMLIVTADHGLTFIPGLSYRDFVNKNVTASFEDIYRVPLFVHYPEQAGPVVDDCAVSVLDIDATVQAVTGVKGVTPTEGSDLRDCPGRKDRSVTWPGGSAQVSTGVRALESRVRYYARWIDSDTDVDGIYRSGPAGRLLGTSVPSEPTVDKSFTWSIDNADEFENVGTEPFSHVPTRAVGRITPARNVRQGEELLIAVDGTFVGEAPEIAGLRAGTRGTFSASLMSRVIGPGDHTVSLWTAVPAGNGFDLALLSG